MARLPRFFVEGQPQHIIQRGNNRDAIFSGKEDYRFYLECLAESRGSTLLIVTQRAQDHT